MGDSVETGTAFLKSQIDNTLAQHRAFLNALEDHEERANDPRFSDLCARHIPHLRGHHRMLEEYQSQLGDDDHVAEAMAGAVVVVRPLADAARESDYLRLVGDIVLARQSEDAFKTFREAGKMMGNRTLQEIGDIGERRHDAFVKEANRLAQHMFVERAQGIDGAERRPRSSDLEATI
ncbi:MAG TPA: hypothetical protein VK544_08935 [Gemmatimonadaceae bacterium]|nr:hypothetical protein [Gemmatimonadaceae bacterium]